MKVAFATLGCKINQYDTATMETALIAQGDEIVPFSTGADAYVINSCSVTDSADAESRQLVRRARRLNPMARVILTGCYAQTSPHTAAAVHEVDHVIGVGRLPDVLKSVRGELDRGERVLVESLRKATVVTTFGAEVFPGQTRAFLKIQEGCDLFCTFCIVPFARGKSRSVEPRRILGEIERLAERGFKEIVLTGIHLGSYGDDLTPRMEFADLVEMIAEVSPVPRIRLSSIDPPEVTPKLLDLVAGSSVICPHLHVPVQAGSDRVLQRMRRQYDTAFLRDVFAEFARRVPHGGLGTDVIAGFPGESDAEFEAGMHLLTVLPFTYFHVFPYSKRTGTTAAKFTDHLPPALIAQRSRNLRKLGESKRRQFADASLGRDLDVLVEQTRDKTSGALTGYSREYVRTVVQGNVRPNDLVRVRGERRVGEHVMSRVVESDCEELSCAV